MIDDSDKNKLCKNDGYKKGCDINGKDWFFGDSSVGVKDEWNEKCKNKQACEFGCEIIWVGAIDITIYKTPD